MLMLAALHKTHAAKHGLGRKRNDRHSYNIKNV